MICNYILYQCLAYCTKYVSLILIFFSCVCLWGFTYCNPAFSSRKSQKIKYMGERNHSINTRITNRISVSIFILSMLTFIGKILFMHWLSVYRAEGSCKKILSWRRSDGFPSPSSQPQQTTQQPGSALVCSHWSDLPVDSAFWYAHISSTVCLEHCDLLLLFLWLKE